MERSGWVVFASVASLLAIGLAANGFLLTLGVTDGFEEQSSEDPPPADWYQRYAVLALYVGVVVAAFPLWFFGYGWAKVRAKSVKKKAVEASKETEELLQPPGFLGKRTRTRRVGLAPLVGFTLFALVLLAGGAALTYFGGATFAQTTAMAGRGFRTAVLWGQLVRYAAIPLAALGTLVLGIAWGRWFPLGELEVIEETQETRLATGYRFQRQD